MNHSRLRSERAHPFAFPPSARLEGLDLFEAENGEQCVCLDPGRHGSLLAAMEELGPVAIITHNHHLRIAGMTRGLDFQPEPTGSGYVELISSLMVNPADWAYGLAVREEVRAGAVFGFQFFDHYGRGQLKLLLTREAQFNAFLSLVRRFAIGGLPPNPVEIWEPSGGEEQAEPTLPHRRTLRSLWPVTRHESGGRYFPGLPGVSRLMALRHVGWRCAREVPMDQVFSLLQEVRRMAFPVRLTLFNQGLSHGICCLPRMVERCSHGIHVFDMEAEFHIALDEELLCWVICKGDQHAIELIRASGERVGLIEAMAITRWQQRWETLLAEL